MRKSKRTECNVSEQRLEKSALSGESVDDASAASSLVPSTAREECRRDKKKKSYSKSWLTHAVLSGTSACFSFFLFFSTDG